MTETNLNPVPEKPASSRWTDEQWLAIQARHKRILVAAAAGSGKTAVLVERIIRTITDRSEPLDIDRLLVATFTNAAAAEMKERVRAALEKQLFRHPDSRHLLRQLMLVGRARIMTLHSFCLEVVRTYFYLLDLDPGFRIANETETELMRQDVLEELFEDYYRDSPEDSGFWRLIDWFGGERSDETLFRLVLQLYDFSRSHPFPDLWLQKNLRSFAVHSPDGFEAAKRWTESILQDAVLALEGAEVMLLEAEAAALQPGGPEAYAGTLRLELEQLGAIRRIVEEGDWDAVCGAFEAFAFGKLKAVKKSETDPELQAQAKALRDQAKKQISGLETALFTRRMETLLAELEKAETVMEALVQMVRDFAVRFGAAKRDKSLVDFSDLEHFCLQALSEPGDSEHDLKPSSAALEYRKIFAELFIDEYQDTNRVQETILQLVAGENTGMFRVGDVKQSIYRFRLADPGLFMEKYHEYPQFGEDPGRLRIDLARNFRSRSEVVDSVNYLFRQIMHKRAAEIDYDRKAELVRGAVFPEPLGEAATAHDGTGTDVSDAGTDGMEDEYWREAAAAVEASDEGPAAQPLRPGPFVPELILINRDAEGETNEAEPSQAAYSSNTASEPAESGENETEAEEDLTSVQMEARIIARRIQDWMGTAGSRPAWITDNKTGGKRRPEYRDIVILLRATESWAPILVEELQAAGIPAHAETRTGYFAAVEVETILSLLKIIDNPLQDIPLAGAMRSPIFGFSAGELARLRLAAPNGAYYEAVAAYGRMEQPDNPELREKAKQFLDKLAEWRKKSKFGALSDFIWMLYRDTGYYDLAGGLPGGRSRQANLRALYDRAKQFDSTSFRGLFRFLRFIDRLRESGGDLGAPSVAGEQEDVVRIMSIHKSKGLEFPLVFIAGLGKSFNLQDLNRPFLLHKDLGFGPKIVDTELRVQYPSLPALAIQRRLKAESLAEEMRILYVAMTRPREKMILIGSVKRAERKLQEWIRPVERDTMHLPAYALVRAGSYLDLLVPALMGHPAFGMLREALGTGDPRLPRDLASDQARWRVALVSGYELQGEHTAAEKFVSPDEIRSALERAEPVPIGSSLGGEAVRRLEWRYAHNLSAGLYAKTSVSEMKRMQDVFERIRLSDGDGIPDAVLAAEPEQAAGLLERPRFLALKGLNAVERGTAYHAVMQHLPLNPPISIARIMETIREMTDKEILSAEQAAAVEAGPILGFLQSEAGHRLMNSPKVRRELPFSLGLPAAEVYPDAGDGARETVLVQGVIDCLFEENGGLVLLDYKTDAVKGKKPEDLVQRYHLQLGLYARAVETILDKPVLAKYLYFFDGGHLIKV